MKRSRLLSLLLSALLLTAVFIPAGGVAQAAGGEIAVYVDGEKLTFDQPPIAQNGRVLVPFRAIFEKLGATVEWVPEYQGVAAQRGDTLIAMQLGKNVLAKQIGDGEAQYFELDVAPIALNGRTLVPVRAVSESLDCNVQWDGANNRVVITSGGQTAADENATDENRVYSDTSYKEVPCRAVFDGDIVYFSFGWRQMLYRYDGVSVTSYDSEVYPSEIIPYNGKVYYYGNHSNQTIFCIDPSTGSRTMVFNQNGELEIEEMMIYRDYLLVRVADHYTDPSGKYSSILAASVYVVDLNTGSSKLLYQNDDFSSYITMTAANGKIYLNDYFDSDSGWSHSIIEADPATSASRTLYKYDDVGREIFCAADGSGIYFYVKDGDVKTYYFHNASTGARQTVSESSYNAAKNNYLDANDYTWTADWRYTHSQTKVVRVNRSTDLQEVLYQGHYQCRRLANNDSKVVFVENENGFNYGSNNWGATSIYIMDSNGNNVKEIWNNGTSASGGSSTGSGGSTAGSEPCAVCNGDGMVTCPYCRGTGQGQSISIMGMETPQSCTYCGGTGRRLCIGCGGSGVKN
ncbi:MULTISPECIES: stalk domain-containing protein [unclassified Flavonifractor]|uniref:stalk domain-containing protein n=1 Tax=unclassified Flavonifractor TaxID=2629267 RepID=UPI000B38BDAB|nr:MULTISPECIES: stalk domain-containing protein [unclassified Flavonifractor]OUN83822.1 hypothetical protein B5G06_06455 [Flavonifractor sp. An52]OUO17143.1 hypothetical protein B5F94_03985 [Flavonifractor sp. An4]